jgi:hypothetical protein
MALDGRQIWGENGPRPSFSGNANIKIYGGIQKFIRNAGRGYQESS